MSDIVERLIIMAKLSDEMTKLSDEIEQLRAVRARVVELKGALIRSKPYVERLIDPHFIDTALKGGA